MTSPVTKDIPKSFLNLSGVETADVMQDDLSGHLRKNGDVDFKDASEHSRDSLSYVILPHAGEKTCISVGNLSLWEKGNDSTDTPEVERSRRNVTKQESAALNTERGLEKRSFATNHEQNKLSEEHGVNGCSREGCHGSQPPPGESASNATLQTNYQHTSIDCVDTDDDCVASISVAPADDSEDRHENAQRDPSREDSDTNAPVSQECENTESSKNTQTELEETVDAAGDEEMEIRDADSDSPTSPHHPPCLKDHLPNITITSPANNPPPGSAFSRATFSPTDKQIQVPALFSGLRVLRKGVSGPEHDTVAHIKAPPLGGSRTAFTEKVQGSFLDQISQFLNREKRGDEKEEKEELEAEGDQDESKVDGNEESQEEEKKELEVEEDKEVSESCERPKSLSSAEAAFDAFKAFFTPKPLKKDPADKINLDAVRKKIRNDMDVLKMLSERTSSKTPDAKVCISSCCDFNENKSCFF